MSARSYLYVPGDRPEFLAKALGRGSDAVIVDLEDAIPVRAKDEARSIVGEWLDAIAGPPEASIWVRVNGGSLGLTDVEALRSYSAVAGFCLAKAESADDVSKVAALLDGADSSAGLMPLLESARAILDARAIASAPRVSRLQIGEADLAADVALDPGPDDRELTWSRMQVVFASAAAGIDAPLAPVSTDYRDLDALADSTHALRRMGFFGRACIHPAQVGVVNAAFEVSDEAVAEARAVLSAHGAAGGAISIGPDGRMVDEAVLRSARRLVEHADG